MTKIEAFEIKLNVFLHLPKFSLETSADIEFTKQKKDRHKIKTFVVSISISVKL